MTIVGLATDPSTADFFAGFTHNRNCGDGATGDATNPSHPYGTAGNYTLLAMAIDNDRGSSAANDNVDCDCHGHGYSHRCDMAANQRAGPVRPSQASATYQLETDVTTSGTAFIVINQNIILDLNG